MVRTFHIENNHRCCGMFKPDRLVPQHVMETTRKFVFRDRILVEELSVTIPELIQPGYGMYTWPCAPVLAQYIWTNRKKIVGKIVLEIGAGTALPSVVAARCGAKVHISDSTLLPACVENGRKSCRLNDVSDVTVYGITWGHFDGDIFTLPKLDIILVSDCFYDTKDFEDVIVTISFLLDANKKCECWCTYQERNASRSIEHLLRKWNIKCKRVPLSEFGADKPNLAESDLPGRHTIHMFVMSKN